MDVASTSGKPICRAFRLTLREFERLSGEHWSQSFRIRLAQRARKIYGEIYTIQKLLKERAKMRYGEVPKYPFGILEHSYKALIAEGVRITDQGMNRMEARKQRQANTRAEQGVTQELHAPPQPVLNGGSVKAHRFSKRP
jgi:hypothetical protein